MRRIRHRARSHHNAGVILLLTLTVWILHVILHSLSTLNN